MIFVSMYILLGFAFGFTRMTYKWWLRSELRYILRLRKYGRLTYFDRRDRRAMASTLISILPTETLRDHLAFRDKTCPKQEYWFVSDTDHLNGPLILEYISGPENSYLP
jgi:hypothetical protein